jgi:phage terminase large subunit
MYSYNAPPEDDHWVNIETALNLENRVCHHSDYRTVPKDWLGPKFVAMAERKKLVNIIAYNNQYLGLVTGVGGNVFKNVERITLSNYDIEQFDYWHNGLDFGFAVDPVHFIKCRLINNKLTLFDEICQVELATKDLAKELVKKTNFKELIKADSEEPRTINSLQKDYKLNVVGCKKGKDSVRHGIKYLQDLEGIYIDKVRCPNAYAEFKFYKYKKDKDGKYINEFPDKNNHSIDATRYSLDDVILKYGWRIPK